MLSARGKFRFSKADGPIPERLWLCGNPPCCPELAGRLQVTRRTRIGTAMSNDTRIGLLIYGMVNAVLFGIGAITVLSMPSLHQQWKYMLPLVVVLSFVLAWPIAKAIAPRLRARYWRER